MKYVIVLCCLLGFKLNAGTSEMPYIKTIEKNISQNIKKLDNLKITDLNIEIWHYDENGKQKKHKLSNSQVEKYIKLIKNDLKPIDFGTNITGNEFLESMIPWEIVIFDDKKCILRFSTGGDGIFFWNSSTQIIKSFFSMELFKLFIQNLKEIGLKREYEYMKKEVLPYIKLENGMYHIGQAR